MRRKNKTIIREDASVLRPKKLKKFDLKRFLELAEAVKKAVEAEEKNERRYGNISRLAV